jgi:hypothetical protein
MEAARTSEKLVNFYQTTEHYVSESSHPCLCAKSKIVNLVFLIAYLIAISMSEGVSLPLMTSQSV